MIYTTLVDVDLWEGLELCQFARARSAYDPANYCARFADLTVDSATPTENNSSFRY
jgi:hypothetical protein